MENTEKKELATTEISTVKSLNLLDPRQFDTMQRICKLYAKSDIVPDMYKETKTNSLEKAMANTMIAVEMAYRIGANPLMVMQNMYIVYGKPAWSSSFLIATVNACGRFNTLKFSNIEDKGEISLSGGIKIRNLSCYAYTTEKGKEDILKGTEISIQMAISEGWYGKSGSKWKTMPEQMLKYRAASFWQRTYAPELSMGIHTDDEVRDIEDVDFEEVKTKERQTVGFEEESQEDNKPANDVKNGDNKEDKEINKEDKETPNNSTKTANDSLFDDKKDQTQSRNINF
jgi:hypothetical protein